MVHRLQRRILQLRLRSGYASEGSLFVQGTLSEWTKCFVKRLRAIVATTLLTDDYHQLILTCSLGAVPENFEFQNVIDELQDTVRALTGISGAEVEVIVAPVTANPTAEEHLDMERTRLGNVSINASVKEQLVTSQQEAADLRTYIGQLEDILRANNINL